MSAERDAGFAALQAGRAAEAIPYLEQAVTAAPQDLQTLLALGAAYGQTGRHNDAVRTILQAVTLQPSHAEARYRLALAYENAGYRDHALTAAQQALQLGYPEASALVARLSGAAQTPTLSLPTSAVAPNGSPYNPQNPQPTMAMGGAYPPAQPTASYGASAPGGAPPQSEGTTSSYGAAAYGNAPPASYYTPPYIGAVQPPDKFDMRQAIRDWVRVIREPNAFFQEQAGCNGYNAPLSFLITYGLALGLFGLLSGLIRLVLAPSEIMTIMIQMISGVASPIIGALMGAFVWGGVLHLVGRMFGNRQPYHQSFRAAAYARAPLLFVTGVSALVMPFVMPSQSMLTSPTTRPAFGQMVPVQFTQPANGGSTFGDNGSSMSPSGGSTKPDLFSDPQVAKIIQAYSKMMTALLILGPLSLIGSIWTLCLEAIGLRYAQQLSPGAAAGTVIVAVLITTILFVLIFALFGALLVGLIAAAVSHGPPSLIQNFAAPALTVWRGF